MSDIPIIGQTVPRVTGRVEIVRSFSYKHFDGQYNARDFFASQKAECDAADAEAVSDLIHQFCKREVLKAVSQHVAELRQQQRRTG